MMRRRALGTLVTGLGCGIAAAWGLTGSRSENVRPVTSAWRRSLEAVGATYLAENPAATAAEALERLHVPEPFARACLAFGGGPAFARHVRRDFDRGRTVSVGGWVLSVTEVAAAVVAWCERCG
jgi:hypothetical protein